MPVAVFQNHTDEVLTFTLEPIEEQYELPPLAKIGVRYSFDAPDEERTFAYYGMRSITFWCEATREVEIIHPSNFDRLLWDMCANLGFCGGIVNEQPVHVTDLLPADGSITAEEFATLAIRAEGGAKGPSDQKDRWTAQLAVKFCEHMGAQSVPAEALVENLANPFE